MHTIEKTTPDTRGFCRELSANDLWIALLQNHCTPPHGWTALDWVARDREGAEEALTEAVEKKREAAKLEI